MAFGAEKAQSSGNGWWVKRPSDEQIAVWHSTLFRTALRMTGSVEDAADLTQEALCKAWNAWDQFRGTKPIGWLYRILVNCVRDWARERAGAPAGALEEWMIVPAHGSQVAPPEQAVRQEQLACLRQEIQELPNGLREAFIATVLDGYSYEQAAEMLSVPVGTIGSRVYQCRKRLREAMQKNLPEA